jgi:hypothetical protein
MSGGHQPPVTIKARSRSSSTRAVIRAMHVRFQVPMGGADPTVLETPPSIPTDELRHSGAFRTGGNMAKIPFRISTLVLSFALLAAPAAAFAQSGVPARDGNVWAWRDHQPTEADVSQKERATGIALTASQRDSASAAVDQLYQQLMHNPAK